MTFVLLERGKQEEVAEMLVKEYPEAKYYLSFKTPVDLLVAAILSAQTRDEVTNRVTEGLFKHFKNAKDYADSNTEAIIKHISGVAFAGAKAKNIKKSCKIIVEKYQGRVPDRMEELTDLPGIGKKTANTILINAYGIVEGIPVDTWVIKLSHRIGLSKNRDPDKIGEDLKGIVDRRHWKKFAYVMKAHGKKICQSQVPICSICFLNKICPRNDVKVSK